MMRKLLELIKDTPWGVMVAIVFLLAGFVTICFIAPKVALVLGAITGTFLSFLRILHYINYGN
jgi:hypothetical protein